MQKYDIHVCLVSAQAAPNLLPILDSEFKPQERFLLFLPKNEIKEKANSLKLAFNQNCVSVEILELSNEFDFQSMENRTI